MGGAFQYRDVGVQFEGDNITSARLFYRLMLANGIGYFGTNDKRDNHVAVTWALGAEPIEGLKFMYSGQVDRFEKDRFKSRAPGGGPLIGLPSDAITYLHIASVVFMNPDYKFEFIAEGTYQKSVYEDDLTGKRFTKGAYTYAGYKLFEKITPYALFDWANVGDGEKSDPYYSPRPLKVHSLTLGVRYNLTPQFVIKGEIEQTRLNIMFPDMYRPKDPINEPGVFIKTDDGFTQQTISSRARIQFAFMF